MTSAKNLKGNNIMGNEALARPLAQVTAELKAYKQQAAQSFIEIGKRLIEAKAQLSHGEWLEWLKNEAEFSERSAQNFMRIAENYSNPQPIADLSYTKLLALLQVPEDEREQFLAESHLVNGEEKTVQDMTTRELEQVVRERDEANQRAADVEKKLKKANAQVRDISVDLIESQVRIRNLQDKLKVSDSQLDAAKLRENDAMNRLREAQRQLEEAASRPVDVAVREPSPEEMERLREEGRQQARQQLANQQDDDFDFGPSEEELREADDAFYHIVNQGLKQYQSIVKYAAAELKVDHIYCTLDRMKMFEEELRTLYMQAKSTAYSFQNHGDLPDWMEDKPANG